MNKENSINKFLKKKEAKNHYPALGKGSLSGIIVEADEKTGLAKNIERIVEKGVFKK
jgi:calcineurin-like phosphoesterase